MPYFAGLPFIRSHFLTAASESSHHVEVRFRLKFRAEANSTSIVATRVNPLNPFYSYAQRRSMQTDSSLPAAMR